VHTHGPRQVNSQLKTNVRQTRRALRIVTRINVAALLGSIAIVASCASTPPEPRPQVVDKGALIDESESGNVILYVSNQSYTLSPVDISVSIDDQPLLSAEFRVVDQHNYVRYQFDWTPGVYVLRATSEKGSVFLEQTVEIADQAWGFVGFWYDPPRQQEKVFTVFFQDEPIGFR